MTRHAVDFDNTPPPPCTHGTKCPLAEHCRASGQECEAFRRYLRFGHWMDRDVGSALRVRRAPQQQEEGEEA